jgi:hypothetical protein
MSAGVWRLIDEFGGQQIGGVVVVYEDGTHKEAARCIEGTWIISPEFRERMDATPAPAPVAKAVKAPRKPAQANTDSAE